jgi:hypothetical protein
MYGHGIKLQNGIQILEWVVVDIYIFALEKGHNLSFFTTTGCIFKCDLLCDLWNLSTVEEDKLSILKGEQNQLMILGFTEFRTNKKMKIWLF